MKRLISVVVVCALLCSVAPVSLADEGESRALSPVMAEYFSYIEEGGLDRLITRSNYGFMQFAENFRTDVLAQYLIQMTDNLIQTGYEPDVDCYVKVLSNIILSYDADNADDIMAQVAMDNLKDFKDYAMDYKDAAVDVVNILTAGTESSAIPMLVDAISLSVDTQEEWFETLCMLDTIIIDYSQYDRFLEMIEQNSDGDLQTAAQLLRHSLDAYVEYRYKTFLENGDNDAKNCTEFFVSDIAIDAIKGSAVYAEDPALQIFTEAADVVVTIYEFLTASWDLGLILGKTIGNLVVGGENLIRRVLEILALYDICDALQTGILSMSQEAMSKQDDDLIKEVVGLSQMLVNCKIRGEYCNYSIIACDAGLLSWANISSADEAYDWYLGQTNGLGNIKDMLQRVLDADVSPIDEKATVTAKHDPGLVETRTYRYSDPSEESATVFQYTFDDRGLLVEKFRVSESYPTTFRYTYDDAGRLLRKVSYSTDYEYEVLSRTYDDQGRLTSETGPLITDSRETREYTYGDDGRIDSEYWHGEWINDMHYVRSYEDHGDGSFLYIRHRTDEVDYPIADTEFVYDANGFLIQGFDEYWGEQLYYTYFDDPNYLIREEAMDADFGHWQETYVVFCDAAGNDVDEICVTNGEPATFDYDEEGRLVTAWGRDEYTEFFYSDSKTVESVGDINTDSSPSYGALADMPSQLVLASGAGAWADIINIGADWSFEGQFHDSNSGPEPTCYLCEYSGQFSEPVQINDFTYSMIVEELYYDDSGAEYEEGGIHYYLVEPYLELGEEILIYVPGAPLSEMTEELLGWAQNNVRPEIRDSFPSGLYSLYSPRIGVAFLGVSEDSFWYRPTFDYTYNGYKTHLWARTSGVSRIDFYRGESGTEIGITFTWESDDQTDFEGYDNSSGRGYHIHIDIAPDNSSVFVEVQCHTSEDFTRWGGTSDGFFAATYTRSDSV